MPFFCHCFYQPFYNTSAVLELILGLPCGFTDRFLLFNLMVYGVDDHPFSLITLFPYRTVPRSGRARAPGPMGRWGGWLSDWMIFPLRVEFLARVRAERKNDI